MESNASEHTTIGADRHASTSISTREAEAAGLVCQLAKAKADTGRARAAMVPTPLQAHGTMSADELTIVADAMDTQARDMHVVAAIQHHLTPPYPTSRLHTARLY